MNERIKELMDQARDETTKGISFDTGLSSYSKRFSDLIVKECIDQLCVSDPTEDFDKGVIWAAQQIKEHFRVEE